MFFILGRLELGKHGEILNWYEATFLLLELFLPNFMWPELEVKKKLETSYGAANLTPTIEAGSDHCISRTFKARV